jgi:hypothetical protein
MEYAPHFWLTDDGIVSKEFPAQDMQPSPTSAVFSRPLVVTPSEFLKMVSLQPCVYRLRVMARGFTFTKKEKNDVCPSDGCLR